ncbi:polyprenyl synthetase family protein [Thiomicrospira microaerophila]|uniref:polyprenyl synthetase family protein n=1 Tax=Thiomicrospira microaerophila TaxID=406020 RepID=UPI00200F8C16|nr:farnesyl diphosphate synthase [Thiomicrospira microaerophila]UQB41472.1 polyprenyl synthetase family protein [Thiomicrospira microaerophila]
MKSKLKQYQKRVEEQISRHLSERTTDMPQRLQNALNYASLSPGKRLRPALIYAVTEGLALPLKKVDPAACAIELIHSYSLVHDDLPAMDDDDLRRGQPTCHKKFDEATAILTGDSQLTLAFEIMACTLEIAPEQRTQSIQILAKAAGAQGMIAGQMRDIQAENKTLTLEKLIQVHRLKTGALIEAALLLGAVPHPDYLHYQAWLSKLGHALGLAFQIQDDILDIEGNTATLGKTQGRDQALNKSTFPQLLGLEKAKVMRDQQIQLAHDCHQKLGFNSLFLKDLINFTAQREH